MVDSSEENASGCDSRSAREKPPSFQWYPKDCDTDERIRLMNDAEFGFYMRCLNHSWLNGGLPGDLGMVARALSRTPAYVRKMWTMVGPCFTEVGGRFVNRKQESQRARDAEFRDGKSDAGRKGADARWNRSANSRSMAQPLAQPLKQNSPPSASSSASPSANQNHADADGRQGYWAERLYARHPKKKNKPLVEFQICQLWASRGEDAEAFFTNIDRVHALWCQTPQWTKQNASFAPRLDEWLSDDGYTSEPVEDF